MPIGRAARWRGQSKRLVVAAIAALVACRGSEATLAKPFLWVVERDGRSTVLFGTMHMGVDPLRQLPEAVWSRLDAAPAFAMEANPADAIRIDATRSDDGSLARDLGSAKWHALESLIGKDAARRVDRLKPYVAATLVASSGLPRTQAMDAALLSRARAAHKRVVFLEPVETQIAALEKWMTARELAQMLDDVPAVVARSRQLLRAYMSGEEAAIAQVVDAERQAALERGRTEAEFRDQMAELLDRRNAAWMPTLERFHADGGGFVAVGTLHLIAPGSVIDLLRQRGYHIRRIDLRARS